MILVEKKNLDRKIFSNCPVNEFIFWNLNWFLGNLTFHEKKSKLEKEIFSNYPVNEFFFGIQSPMIIYITGFLQNINLSLIIFHDSSFECTKF